MIEYIVADNIDDRILARAAAALDSGGLVAFPTDTTWSVACSIASRDGVSRLKRLAGRDALGPLTVICSTLEQAARLCDISTRAYRVIRPLVPGPYVFVLPSTNKAAKDFDLRRGELGFRMPASPVPPALVDALGQALLSVTAKRSMLGFDPEDADFPEELLFSSGQELEDLPGVSMVLDPGEEQERRVSTVLDLRGPETLVLRAGTGPYP